MMQSEYGRLLAALVAAGSAHAVLLFVSGAVSLAVQNSASPSLQVELVVAEQPVSARFETDQAVEAKPKEERPPTTEAKLPPHPDSSPAAQQIAATPKPQVAYHADADAGEETVAATESAAAAEPLPVPADIQAGILAQVHYPNLARRRGWEGQVDLRFDVSNRTVTDITILKVSAHPVLNEAAREGVLRMRAVALADGRYRMPVVFRLR